MGSFKILYVARGGQICGSQRQLLNLLNQLDRSLYEPKVICSEGGDMAEKLSEMHIETQVYPRIFGWRTLRFLLQRYLFRAALLRQYASHGIDLIHCSYPWYSPYCLFLAERLQCPCVIHMRGPAATSMVKNNKLSQADEVIAVSVRIRKDLIDAGIPAEKISLIFDGIDTDIFYPRPQKHRLFSTNGELVFGLVGRIEAAKYQLEFIRAAELLAARNRKAKFVLIGQEKDPAYARQVRQRISKAGLSDRVICCGRSESMPEVLDGLDVLVSLSGGSVMYEAMACGVPVLSAGFTQKQNAVHVIDGYNAMLLDSREPGPVAAAMEKLLQDQTYRNTLAANTRTHIMQHLSDRVNAAQTQAVYHRLLSRQRLALSGGG